MGTHPIFESDFDCLTDRKVMPPKKPFRPSKNEYDRAMDDFGLSGVMNKDMSLYPKLELYQLPFPYSDQLMTDKMDQLNAIAADLEQKFRKSAAYISRKSVCTPDVQRYC